MSDLSTAAMRAALQVNSHGTDVLRLAIGNLRCGGCVSTIEKALQARADVAAARVNLTLRQLVVTLPRKDTDAAPIVAALAALGFPAVPVDANAVSATAIGEEHGDAASKNLIRALAVAGFGAANIMVLSVGNWSGAEGATRSTFNFLSAAIALPVVAYSGRPFFGSAWRALQAGRVNMDVPIALAVVLTLVLSLVETIGDGAHVFFDAAVTLLFLLLAGRTLDYLMRNRARSAITGLARLAPRGASVRQPDGAFVWTPVDKVVPGALLAIGPGERVPVDCRVVEGISDIDRALVTGESDPVVVRVGDDLAAGTLNLTGVVAARALRPAADSFLSQIITMQGAAEISRGRYVRIADRAAQIYAPAVHIAAAATFIGWLVATDGDWRRSLCVAISVLIITCPCALGLAVPVAHVIAAGRLLRSGVLVKDGSALERLAEIDSAVFDKTGTLTTGTPAIAPAPMDPAEVAGARMLANASRHPVARAIARHLDCLPITIADVADVAEVPGQGVEARVDGRMARLGSACWVGEIAHIPADMAGPVFGFANGRGVAFDVSESLRPGAQQAVSALRDAGIDVAILSGDGPSRVDGVAAALAIGEAVSDATPAAKMAWLEARRSLGHHVLMVGDGLNDAPALAAAHVSMAPASASDAGRAVADFIILGDSLDAVPAAWQTAMATARIVRQNFIAAFGYNIIAVPLAVFGLVTPLIAAIAMSASSLLVIANAMRLNASPRPMSTAA